MTIQDFRSKLEKANDSLHSYSHLVSDSKAAAVKAGAGRASWDTWPAE